MRGAKVRARAIAAVAAVTALAGLAVPATAPATETLSCTVRGLFGANPGVGWLGQFGISDYGWGGRPTCSYSNTTTGVHVPQATGMFDAAGTLTWSWCGLPGMELISDHEPAAAGAGTSLVFEDPRMPDITQFDYRVELVAWKGTLRGGNLIQDRERTIGSINGDERWSATGAFAAQPMRDTLAFRDDCFQRPIRYWEMQGNFTAIKP